MGKESCLNLIYNLILNLIYKSFIIFFTLTFILSSPFIIILVFPCYIYRTVVSIYSFIFCRNLYGLISPLNSIMASENIKNRPKGNSVIWFVLKGELSLNKLKREVNKRMIKLCKNSSSKKQLIYPELQFYYTRSSGFLHWKKDTIFSVDNHVKYLEDLGFLEEDESDPITEERVSKINETLLSSSWPEDRSPWRIWLVPNYKNGGSSSDIFSEIYEGNNVRKTLLLFHFHNGLADPYSFLKMIFHTLANLLPPDEDLLKEYLNERSGGCGSFLKNLFTFPILIPVISYQYCKQFLNGFDINQWQLAEKELKRKYFIAKIKKIPIKSLKTIQSFHRVSLAATLISALSGGIRKYLRNRGMSTPNKMQVYIPFPKTNHPSYRLTSCLTGCLVRLPLELSNPKERLVFCQNKLEAIRKSKLPLINWLFPKMIGLLPIKYIDLWKNFRATGIWLNFPGTTSKISILDHEVEEISCNSGNFFRNSGFTLTSFSYNGLVNIDLSIDRSLVPSEADASALIMKIREELNILWEENSVSFV